MQAKLILVVVAVAAGIVVAEGLKIELLRDQYGSLGTNLDFYEEEYQNGLSTSVRTSGACVNLPKRWHRRAQAVDTRGTCGQVCSELDCKGECAYVLPNVGEQHLKDVKMNKKIVSAQGCFPNQ